MAITKHQWKVGDIASTRDYSLCYDDGSINVIITAIGENVILVKEGDDGVEFMIKPELLSPPLSQEEQEFQVEVRDMVDKFNIDYYKAKAIYQAGYRKVESK